MQIPGVGGPPDPGQPTKRGLRLRRILRRIFRRLVCLATGARADRSKQRPQFHD
jgi:hypothetical protein